MDGGERAIIWDMYRGITDRVIGEGTHMRIPILQRPIIMDIRVRPQTISTTTGSRDLQTVNITLRLLHKPNERGLPALYRSLGLNYDERVLPSVGNEVMKAVVAQFNAEELITNREHVSRMIYDQVIKRASDFNVEIKDIAITHLTFGREFTQAVEHKVVAQQEAERAKFIVMKAEQQKLAAIIRAEGEATSAKLIANALKAGPGFVDLRQIQAARQIAIKLSQSPNITYIPRGGANFLLDLDGKRK